MGLPAKQRTRTSKKDRASHFALKKTNLVACQSCGAKKMPHSACPSCGTYKGKTVINTKKRTVRRAKRLKKIS